MSTKNYYVITVRIGGDSDMFCYIFTDETYFKAFLEFSKYADRANNKAIISLIEDHKEVDGMFDWVTDLDLSDKYLYQEYEKVFKDTYVSVSTLAQLMNAVKDGVIADEGEVIIS